MVLSQVQSVALTSIGLTVGETDGVLNGLMAVLGEALQCDLCFLYLRNPATRMGKVSHCWRRHEQIPLVYDLDWKPEPESLLKEDPMFAAALQTKPTIFVDDVETADAAILNRSFEQQEFGHRALVHAHLCHESQLWGVLQPCVFDHPKGWSERERSLITNLVPALTPMAIAYVKTCCQTKK